MRIVLLLLLASTPAAAHDLFMLPGKFRLAPGERTSVFINSGDVFPESAALVEQERVEALTVHTAKGAEPLAGFRVDRSSLVSELSVAQAGTAVVAIALKPERIRLNADDFNGYLAHDGLPQILRLRADRDEMGKPAQERYTKWAKTIVKVGEEGDDLWSQPVGMKLEIVPLTNPLALKAGNTLELQVLFDGAPLPGVIVLGGRAGAPAREITTWTDVKGRTTCAPSQAGRWLVHVVHMVRLEGDTDVQWESFWTTLTFEVSTP